MSAKPFDQWQVPPCDPADVTKPHTVELSGSHEVYTEGRPFTVYEYRCTACGCEIWKERYGIGSRFVTPFE